MASQALYRRYRSQTFDELIGQEHVVQTLRNAIAEGRIAHAYLFTGPRGVGKTSVARLLAKAVNCTAPEAQRPCGVCSSCVEIAEGRSVDVIEMDAASHTSVDDAREIIERVQFRPTNGRYKVYIIDETHMLSTAAFNALLKTLEEPPGHALFILATTEVHKVPATILSRCQRFVFNRHTIASTTMHLKDIAQQEGFVLEPSVPEAIARAATGSMRDALSLMDQLMAYGSPTITLEQVQGLIGSTAAQDVATLIDGLLANDATIALQAISGVAEQGADLRQFARDVVDRLRALMLLKASGDTALLDVGEDELRALEVQAQVADLGLLLHWVKLFSALDYQIRTATIPQLPLEMAVIEALIRPAAPSEAMRPTTSRPVATAARPVAQRPTPPPTTRPTASVVRETPTPVAAAEPAEVTPEPVAAAAETVQPAQEAKVEEPVVTPQAEPEPEAPPQLRSTTTVPTASDGEIAQENAAAAVLERVEAIWPEVIRDVRIYDKTLQALLNSGVKPIDIKDTTIILEAPSEWLMKRLEQPNLRQIVEKVIAKHVGTVYAISCVVEAQRGENPNELREQIRNARKDPLVKAAMNIFDADIIAVERDS